ncbi:amino acid racemase [Amycolatopsis sp. SID8362]|uniref:aspartate/glutamate racemase family protein n=1 Tax=Amycolatopsis sp. SID8362 TaxID=2690346 RepID=UPI00136CA1A7|nr:amino acid racemase [Amycolatopsis sp. SID8362]NBH07725.1 amino acid racemase [Amycolatopsis sp. SID8362]NED44420.1 amino acid racemase [Amycolatopsis sp. SID8362]
MKTIGLIGGLSWYSTSEYYRVINEEVQRRLGGHASAKIALQSLNFAEIRRCQQQEDWAAAGALLAEAGKRCESAGADLVLICANLMHKCAPAAAAAVEVPLLHITDAIARRARRDGHVRVGLLGARWVMEEDFYRGRLEEAGLDVVVPDPDGRALVDRIIFEELTRGIIDEASRAAYADIITGLVARGAEAVVLGCTEIELLIDPDDSPVPILDSMRLHAEAAVDIALAAGSEAAA